VLTAAHLAAKQRAREAARTGINLELERLILQFTAEDLRSGIKLTPFDLARAELARERIAAAEERAA
jgi:hypothetical protein